MVHVAEQCESFNAEGADKMDAVRLHEVVEQDGQVTATGLPFKKGQRVEVIVMPEVEEPQPCRGTARDLLNSPLCGIWKGRDDIGDSVEFARELREHAQTRRRSEG